MMVDFASVQVIAISIGPKQAQETLRTALAMGADKAIHIQTDKRTDQEVLPLAVAKMLKNIAEREQAQLVLLGKQSIDGDNAQTGPMLSAMLDWPLATFAAKLSFEGQEMTVERETDSGTETIAMNLPAVVTTDLRLNEPRYATLPNIMKVRCAKRTIALLLVISYIYVIFSWVPQQ